MTSLLQAPAVSRPSVAERARQIDVRDPTVLAVATLTLLTFVVRFAQIHQGLLGDEVWTYQDIYGRSFRAVLTNVHTGGENSPPLFFLMAYAAAKLGDPTVWIRLPSIILSSLTLPVVYLIGRETVGRIAGLLAALVLALSPFAFYYGVEARPYASMAFFLAVSTWALLRAVDTNRWPWWCLYVAAAVASAYSHYTSIFVLLVQGVWSLWVCRDRVRIPLIAGAAALALYSPWLPQLRGKALAVIGALHPFTAGNVFIDLMRPIAGYPIASLNAIPTIPGLVILIGGAFVGALFLARAPRPPHFWLLFAVTIATPIGMFLYSLTQTDLWLARGLYASAPFAALVLGTLLVSIPRPGFYAALGLLAAVLIVGTVRAASPSWRRPPSRAEAAYLDRIAPSSDPIALVSFINAPAILAQFHHYHHNYLVTQVFKAARPGQEVFLFVDDKFGRTVHVPAVPRAPAGFVLVRTRHFNSAVSPTDITTYRRVS